MRILSQESSVLNEMDLCGQISHLGVNVGCVSVFPRCCLTGQAV